MSVDVNPSATTSKRETRSATAPTRSLVKMLHPAAIETMAAALPRDIPSDS